MNKSEPWTRASLRVTSELLSVKELETLFGLDSAVQDDGYWLVDLEESSYNQVDEVLESVARFLDRNIESFRSIKGRSQVELRIGWAPVTGLAGMAIDKNLIRLLSEADADFLLDVYGE